MKVLVPLLLLLLFCFQHESESGSGLVSGSDPCSVFDGELQKQRQVVCQSLAPDTKTWWCDPGNATADGDWPNQAVYFLRVLSTLSTGEKCLQSRYAADTVRWMKFQGNVNVTGGMMWTWRIFQGQYYSMPRKAGTRIESPDTLGRKCWAFAYLGQFWEEGLGSALETALSKNGGYDIGNFTSAYQAAIGYSMDLCEKVMANCFENSTYTPSRNGTCNLKVYDFKYLGFERENLKRRNCVHYPFY